MKRREPPTVDVAQLAAQLRKDIARDARPAKRHKALAPRADKSLVIVVCTDADGNTHNEYVRDTDLRRTLSTATVVRDKADAEATLLSRATTQIYDRANPQPATEP